jgi:hypothetical protein
VPLAAGFGEVGMDKRGYDTNQVVEVMKMIDMEYFKEENSVRVRVFWN